MTLALYFDKEQRDQFTSYPKLGFGGGAFINLPLKRIILTWQKQAIA
jgi:hypothetical protein